VLELRHRTHGLNARVRQVLILLDGTGAWPICAGCFLRTN
jgi:hypothetical protein